MPSPSRRHLDASRRPVHIISWSGAIRRNLALLSAPVLVLVLVAVVAGLARQPNYTSVAVLDVDGLSFSQAATTGYSVAIDTLAIQYARAIDALAVTAPVTRALGVSRSDITRQVSATPTLNSPLIVIRATSPNRALAVRLADAASASLVHYALNLNSGQVAAARLLDRYLSASRALRASEAAMASRAGSSRSLTPAAAVALLRLQTSGGLYVQAQVGRTLPELLQRLAPAEPPSSDRSPVLQLYVVVAAIIGLLVGAGLTALRETRRWKRRLVRTTGATRGAHLRATP